MKKTYNNSKDNKVIKLTPLEQMEYDKQVKAVRKQSKKKKR